MAPSPFFGFFLAVSMVTARVRKEVSDSDSEEDESLMDDKEMRSASVGLVLISTEEAPTEGSMPPAGRKRSGKRQRTGQCCKPANALCSGEEDGEHKRQMQSKVLFVRH